MCVFVCAFCIQIVLYTGASSKHEGALSGLAGLVSRTGRGYNPRQTLMLSGLDGAVIRIGRIDHQAIS